MNRSPTASGDSPASAAFTCARKSAEPGPDINTSVSYEGSHLNLRESGMHKLNHFFKNWKKDKYRCRRETKMRSINQVRYAGIGPGTCRPASLAPTCPVLRPIGCESHHGSIQGTAEQDNEMVPTKGVQVSCQFTACRKILPPGRDSTTSQFADNPCKQLTVSPDSHGEATILQVSALQAGLPSGVQP